jgi:hypothetical protein
MSDLTDKDIAIMQAGRLLRAEAVIVLPMLDERRESAIRSILMHYKAGDIAKLTNAAAELSVTEDMKEIIKRKIKLAEQVERKHDGN